MGRMLVLRGSRFQYRIINADVFALGIKLLKLCSKAFGAPGSGNLFEIWRSLRQMFTQRASQCACLPKKHTAVPVVVAGCSKLFSLLLVGFFGEPFDPKQL